MSGCKTSRYCWFCIIPMTNLTMIAIGKLVQHPKARDPIDDTKRVKIDTNFRPYISAICPQVNAEHVLPMLKEPANTTLHRTQHFHCQHQESGAVPWNHYMERHWIVGRTWQGHYCTESRWQECAKEGHCPEYFQSLILVLLDESSWTCHGKSVVMRTLQPDF